MSTKRWKLYRKLTQLTYASGIVFLLVGMVLSAVNQPVFASSTYQQGDPTPVDPGGKDPGQGVDPNPGEQPGEVPPPDSGETPPQDGGEIIPPDNGEVPPQDGGEVPPPDNGEAPGQGESPIGVKPPLTGEAPEKGQKPNNGKPPVRDENPGTESSVRKNLSAASGVSVANPLQDEWNKSSLSFVGGCTDSSCNNVSVQVCNVGDGDMSDSVDWELYYIFEGNPKDGEVLTSGTVGPLGQDECQTLSYNPNGVAGNYMFRAEQEPGHPGTGELWSSGCTIGVCQLTETPQPEIEGQVEFTTSDTAICQYNEGSISATVRVSLPEGVTARLQTQWYVVNPPGSRTSPVYEVHQVSNGDEVTFDATWPGVNLGDEVVEIHWGARLSIRENGIDTQLDTAGLDYYWYPWVCQPQETPTPVPFEKISLSSVCGFSGDEQIQWKVSNPNSYPVDYTWEVEGSSESGSGTASPGDSYFTTDPGLKTVQLFAKDELNDTATSTDACKEDISVNYSCTENGVLFTAFNPNDFAIELNFELDGVSGSASLPANGSSSVAVASPGAHTLNYNWTNGADSRSGSVSSPSDACKEQTPQPGRLSLSYLCVGDGLNWTVTNPNNFAVTFNWEETGGASGTDTVGANSSLTFFKSAVGTTTLNLNYVILDEEFSNSLSNGEDYCQTIPTQTPPPATNTPTPVVPTTTPVVPTTTPGGQNPTQTPVVQNPTATPVDQDPTSTPGSPGLTLLQASTPTPEPTLAPPALSEADAVLIPVTGVDLTTQGRVDFVKNLMLNLGLVFLGMAFISQGIVNKFGPF